MKKIFSLMLLSFILVLGACGSEDESKEDTTEVKKELERDEEIEALAKEIVGDDFNKTDIKKIAVNKNMGLDDGSYIVLPHLTWDVKNKEKMTREMLSQYSNHLAAILADESDISEITVFWEVPYHKEGENIAKFNFTREGDGMAKGDVWYDPLIRE